MDDYLRYEFFRDVSLCDPFFDSLKADYAEFSEWYKKKGEHGAYTFRNEEGLLDGFLYLKIEDGPVMETTPQLLASRRLKIGTFKVNPHGTRLGERFIKRAFDVAVEQRVQALYVTIFERHAPLIDLFYRYGFIKRAVKNTLNGQELVLERRLDSVVGDVVLDYPRIPISSHRHFILSLYPKWHSRLLPDSLLTTESSSILQDVSHTNSIHKIYLTAMRGVDQLKRGDTLLIYRTADGAAAYYTSVVTSLCVVEDVTDINTFSSEGEFVRYCSPYSIFTERELRDMYKSKRYPWIIRFTYNLALQKRINRQALIEQVGLMADIYWGFFQVTTKQLQLILELSGDHEKENYLIYTP